MMRRLSAQLPLFGYEDDIDDPRSAVLVRLYILTSRICINVFGHNDARLVSVKVVIRALPDYSPRVAKMI